MRKAFIIILIFINTYAFSQDLTIGIFQDVRLLLIKDILGNKPPQLDAIIICNLKWKYTNIGINYENAILSSPFHRCSIGGGLHYRLKHIELGQSLNGGYIIRPFSTSFSLSSHSTLGFIYKRWELIGLIQITQRTEWGDLIRWSGFIGINYLIL